MPAIKGNYPHGRFFQPLWMDAPVVWAFAEGVRRQLLGTVRCEIVDVREMARRAAAAEINGIAFSMAWDFDNQVHDEDGRPVMGVCEYDGCAPDQALICVNGPEIGGRPEIERSTTLHELGHALFETPAVVWAAKHGDRLSGGDKLRGIGEIASRRPDKLEQEREWRANEFMGGFLAPPSAFHQRLVRLANQAELPLLCRPSHGKPGMPVVDGRRADAATFEHVVQILAEDFGISADFARVRIDKYGLLAGREG